MRFSAKYIFRIFFFKRSALKMLFFHLHSPVKPGRHGDIVATSMSFRISLDRVQVLVPILSP